jgi:hypothetical protein
MYDRDGFDFSEPLGEPSLAATTVAEDHGLHGN